MSALCDWWWLEVVRVGSRSPKREVAPRAAVAGLRVAGWQRVQSDVFVGVVVSEHSQIGVVRLGGCGLQRDVSIKVRMQPSEPVLGKMRYGGVGKGRRAVL